MSEYNIYADIASRTGGDIYIGVVGPVRTGKSTFIKRFMERSVIPNIADAEDVGRATDELPQSATGKTIMTTEPKFVPNAAVKVKLGSTEANIRLIDCVGYLVEGALGAVEDDRPRMISTPWSDEKMPFEKAAELGTEKVIKEHSTIAVVVTTDGSFTGIPSESYRAAEERVIKELKASGKPFTVVVNSSAPDSELAEARRREIENEYSVKAVTMNVDSADKEDFEDLLTAIVMEFPIKRVDVELPDWLFALGDHPAMSQVVGALKTGEAGLKMGDAEKFGELFTDSEYLMPDPDISADAATGAVHLKFAAAEGAFYKVLSEKCGEQLYSERDILTYLIDASYGLKQYNKIASAMDKANETGYGVVTPSLSDMKLEAPELTHRGAQYGIKLKAVAPSYHMIKVDVETEVNPIIGSETSSAELSESLKQKFESDPEGLWETNFLGKPLSELVAENMSGKTGSVPENVQVKLRKALKRVVNEQRGSILCILI